MRGRRHDAELADQHGNSGTERVLSGLGVSSGIAIGPVHLVESGVQAAPYYVLMPDAVPAEQKRFAAATDKARRQLVKLKSKAEGLPETAAEEITILMDAHLAMLGGSRLIRGVDRRIADQRLNAEAAVQMEIADIVDRFDAMSDPLYGRPYRRRTGGGAAASTLPDGPKTQGLR